MASKKGTGSTRNGRDSNSQRLGVKRFGGQKVTPGCIIVRQRGTSVHAGKNVGVGRDYTLYSLISGVVVFERRGKSGKKASVFPVDNVFLDSHSYDFSGDIVSGDKSRESSLKPAKDKPNSQETKKTISMLKIEQSFERGLRTLTFDSRLLDCSIEIKGAKIDIVSIPIVSEQESLDVTEETLARLYLKQVVSNEQPHFFKSGGQHEIFEFKSQVIKTFKRTGITTIKFSQCYFDIPLYGSLAIVTINEERKLLSVKLVIAPPTTVKASYRLDSEEVLAVVSKAAGHDSHNLLSEPKPYFFHDSELESWTPVFIVSDVLKKNSAKETFMPEVVDYVVDANTGRIIAEIPRTQ